MARVEGTYISAISAPHRSAGAECTGVILQSAVGCEMIAQASSYAQGCQYEQTGSTCRGHLTVSWAHRNFDYTVESSWQASYHMPGLEEEVSDHEQTPTRLWSCMSSSSGSAFGMLQWQLCRLSVLLCLSILSGRIVSRAVVASDGHLGISP